MSDIILTRKRGPSWIFRYNPHNDGWFCEGRKHRYKLFLGDSHKHVWIGQLGHDPKRDVDFWFTVEAALGAVSLIFDTGIFYFDGNEVCQVYDHQKGKP